MPHGTFFLLAFGRAFLVSWGSSDRAPPFPTSQGRHADLTSNRAGARHRGTRGTVLGRIGTGRFHRRRLRAQGSTHCNCKACHHHAANKLFATRAAAQHHRAHPGCKCTVVQTHIAPRPGWPCSARPSPGPDRRRSPLGRDQARVGPRRPDRAQARRSPDHKRKQKPSHTPVKRRHPGPPVVAFSSRRRRTRSWARTPSNATLRANGSDRRTTTHQVRVRASLGTQVR